MRDGAGRRLPLAEYTRHARNALVGLDHSQRRSQIARSSGSKDKMRSSKSRSRSKTNRPRTLGNIINRVFESSGPEGKVRGTPQQIIEKYQFLARDARLSNDRVAVENFLQHAEHYTRLLGEAQREMAAEQEERQRQQGQNGNQQGYLNGNGQNRDRNDNRDNRPEFREDRADDDRPVVAVIDYGTSAGQNLVETPEAHSYQQRRDDRHQGGERQDGERRDRGEFRRRDDRSQGERQNRDNTQQNYNNQSRQDRPRDDRLRDDRRDRYDQQAKAEPVVTAAQVAAVPVEEQAVLVGVSAPELKVTPKKTRAPRKPKLGNDGGGTQETVE